MATQRHDYFSNWSKQEQEKFKSEQASMWNLIPAEFRAKAERLAKGGYN